MARRTTSTARAAAQLPFDTSAPAPEGQATIAPTRPGTESAASCALAAIRAWEASVERDWLAGGAWAIIQGDPRYDAAATDVEDPDYAGNVAVFADSSRLLAKAEGWTVGPRRRARDPLP